MVSFLTEQCVQGAYLFTALVASGLFGRSRCFGCSGGAGFYPPKTKANTADLQIKREGAGKQTQVG